MNKVLLILGMHRSGTSLVANWLHECGLHLGERLFKESIYNEKGYFEDRDFIEIHEQIFCVNNISSGGFVPPLDFTVNEEYRDKIRNLVEFKNMRQQWGWKEPRTCLFIDYYKQLIPGAKFLILYRDYSFVVDSLIRRELKIKKIRFQKLSFINKIRKYWKYRKRVKNALSKKDLFLKAWIIYNEKLLKLMTESQGDTFIFTDYESLLHNSSLIFKKITDWGFDLEPKDFKEIYDPKLMKAHKPNLSFHKCLEAQAKALACTLMQFKTILFLLFLSSDC